MTPIHRKVRAYFAPVDRNTGSPTIFDPARDGSFTLEQPPAPWLDLGWVSNLRRWSASRRESASAGLNQAAAARFRTSLAASVEFDFRQWGKLQMALACGAQHMNVLAADPLADPRPSGSAARTAVVLLPGSTAEELVVGSGAVEFANPGDLVAVDVDYQQNTGYVGSGVAGAYVKSADDVKRDADYVRRVTFNVGRVILKTATTLRLAQPLIGGAPLPGAAVQKVVGFVDREGGAFCQEWSALFVLPEESGGRVCFHYPRLSPAGGATPYSPETRFEIDSSLESVALHASFVALPIRDEVDNEAALCYRSYFPAGNAALY
jgi:hypothetical protein